MTKQRLIAEYGFLFTLILLLVVVPHYKATDQAERIAALERQLQEQRVENARIEKQRKEELRRMEIAQRDFSRQVRCLATNVYHEARGESERGMEAVAQVTINRTRSEKFPDDVCEVVYQKKAPRKCQFSWYCDGRSDEIRDEKAWEASVEVATAALQGKTLDSVGGNVVYYHSRKVKPYWSYKKRFVGAIGRHMFYSERS